ncbi:uncharacterized protein LOC127007884 isoform X3 [Eriocheir sinensis]|uniref:uncharacterized protein LOC127007884 isoform X3 n=1 Tax=Eriocheir sinensis TaxID=95602 RepID=UPI0021C7539F|nr:uncharacterized protein LOC127007884 isoform X3 [Eriocheir sinensis]
MSGRRRGAGGGEGGGAGGVARNKRGTPMYSREDIREQYCINDKELHALEASRRKPIFGCLTSGNTQASPCKKKSLLPACLRGRVPSDENVYSKSQSAHTSPAHRSASRGQHQQQDGIDYEDESYFKRRPKTICYTDPRRLSNLDDSLAKGGRMSRPRSEVSTESQNARQTEEGHTDPSRRPTQLPITSGAPPPEDRNREGHTQRLAFTQPNTPDLGHSSRFRPPAGPEGFPDDRPQGQKHVSFQKFMSRSLTEGRLEERGVDEGEGRAGCRGAGESRSHERLLDARRSPDYFEQRALDQLLAPVLTKALLQEKLKRSCMRTQATQTDVGVVRKSMPILPLSPAEEKAEMISQGAQTNGDGGRRKLVKSLSEVARYEGLQYEIYDLDDLYYLHEPPPPVRTLSDGPPPYPPRFSAYDIPLDEGPPPPPPLKFRQNYDEIFDVSPRKPRRGLLQKTLSEGEILSERRRALSLASGYLEVDINGYSDNEEEVIEPQCVDEVSRDLSRSRIFTPESFIEEEEEFHENMLHKEILPSLSSYERKLSQVSTDSELKTFDPNEFRTEEHLRGQLAALSLDSLAEGGPCLLEGTLPPPEGIFLREDSPMLYAGTPCEGAGGGEFGDHLEESMSESQVTVLQRTLVPSSQIITSDSENGSFHLTDPSSAATTPSTRHKSIHAAGSFEEDFEEDMLPRLRVSNLVQSTTTLSSIEDEPTSISENVVSDSSQGPVTNSTTSSEVDKAICGSTDNDYSSIRSGESLTIKSETVEEEEFEGEIVIEENMMARLVQELKGGDALPHIPIRALDFRDEARRLASPESDSSSSLFTEQETSRSPVSGNTNTMTSKSDLSRTDSHPTDQSETSEDYITATENSMHDHELRRPYLPEERHVSSPPGMDDIYEDEALTLTPKILSPEMTDVLAGFHDHHELSDIAEGVSSVASDFETAQDLTSPDGDTTTSASYYIDHSQDSDPGNDTKAKPEVPPKPAFLPRPEVPPKPDKVSPSLDSPPSSQELQEAPGQVGSEVVVRRREKGSEESRTGAIKKRYSAGGKVAKDDNRRYSRYFEDNDKGELSEVRGQGYPESWSEEDREKAKQTMKLDFPPGVTMFGEAPAWTDADSLKLDTEKKLKVFEKPKKSVKIDLASVEDLQAMRSASEAVTEREGDAAAVEVRQVKVKHDKVKRKSEEVTTPGMVRSPAMHEGFRLEDWTPVRTPVTPDRSLDMDSSDESYSETPRHPPKGRSPRRRSKDSPGKKVEGLTRPGESPVKQAGERPCPGKPSVKSRESPRLILQESPERIAKQSPKRSVQQPASPTKETSTAKTERFTSRPLEMQRQSPARVLKTPAAELGRKAADVPEPPIQFVTDAPAGGQENQGRLKPSGPEVGYLRAGSLSPTSRERPLQLPESKLLTIAPLRDSQRSVESLRSMSPGSDNVFLGGSREQLDEETRANLCVQCGERPASREGLLRPNTVAETSAERRLSDRETSRQRNTVTHRAKSEERGSFTRDWGATPISLEHGDAPRHDSDDDEKGVYLDPYRASPWVYVSPGDEAKVWRRDEGSPSPLPPSLRVPGFEEEDVNGTVKAREEAGQDEEDGETQDAGRRGSVESTCSEKEFRRRYQAITHRMVHRKASVEMYRRLVHATFRSEL